MLTTGIGAEETVSVVNIIFTSHAGLDLTDTFVASLSKNAIIKTDTVFIVLGNAITIMIGVQFRHVDDNKKANNVVLLILTTVSHPFCYNLRSFFF